MVRVIAVGKCVRGKVVFTKFCVSEAEQGETKLLHEELTQHAQH